MGGIKRHSKGKLEDALESKARIISQIFLKPGISQNEIAKNLHLTPAAISIGLEEIRNSGIIIERSKKSGSKGRPSKSLFINPDKFSVVAFSLRSEKELFVSVITPLLEIKYTEKLKLPNSREKLMKLMKESYKEFYEKEKRSGAKVLGAGISITGAVNHSSGELFKSTLLKNIFPEKFPLKKVLKERITKNLEVENDLKCATLKELYFGAGKQSKNFALVGFIPGIAIGMVLDGRLHRGAHGLSGEWTKEVPDIDKNLSKEQMLRVVELLSAIQNLLDVEKILVLDPTGILESRKKTLLQEIRKYTLVPYDNFRISFIRTTEEEILQGASLLIYERFFITPYNLEPNNLKNLAKLFEP